MTLTRMTTSSRRGGMAGRDLRITLLQADYVNPDLKHRFGDLPDFFAGLLSRADVPTPDVFEVWRNEFPPADHRPHAYIITGSRHSATDADPWIARLKAFVRDGIAARRKVVGICFGHQILAEALGGRTGPAPGGWNVGVHPLALKRTQEWMMPALPAPNLLFNHRDQVLAPPPGADILAGNARVPIQMFALGSTVLGLQAHPEYPTAYQEALMDLASGLDGATKTDALRRNRDLRRNDAVALQWLVRFINA